MMHYKILCNHLESHFWPHPLNAPPHLSSHFSIHYTIYGKRTSLVLSSTSSFFRHKTEPFLLMLAGDCTLLSAILRAYITRVSFPFWIFLWSDMEKKASPRPSPQTTDDKLKDTQQSISEKIDVNVLNYNICFF